MFWYNGQLKQTDSLELTIDEPGLLYGATVFTTLRVYHQSLDSPLTNWKSHCDRLISSLQTLGWQLPNLPQMRQGADVLSASYPILRITIFPNGREWITGRCLPSDLENRQQLGITAWLADAPEYRRILPMHKTGNYLPSWLAQQASQKQGAMEAILLDAKGNWLETSTGNLWGWKDNCWWTPPLDAGILPGVVRSQLISWLKKQNHPVRELVWDTKLVLSFEAIAYTNSVVEVIPIHTVLKAPEKLKYDPLHPSLKQLRCWWQILS
ncbi:MAG: aminotransferase class IV [Symplocastrum torsivum CPER-KK1]|uniref:Aminotransferase class IV n=1 Tax=Symplocastrum torsivum CPER-KK1 TaxID=450513 RepID=A0A951PNF7_9CYAN|nr:aminotransferase class IV [Symplocastrum torsivum CPER-KK1]